MNANNNFIEGNIVRALPNDAYCITNLGWIGEVVEVYGDNGIAVREVKETEHGYVMTSDVTAYDVESRYFELVANDCHSKGDVEPRPPYISPVHYPSCCSGITDEERRVILSRMCDLLDELGHRYTEKALLKIIAKWESSKAQWIEVIKSHPNYVKGEFCAIIEQKETREVNEQQYREFASYIAEHAEWDESTAEVHYAMRKFYRALRIVGPARLVSAELAAKLNAITPDARVREGQKTSRAIRKFCELFGWHQLPEFESEFAKFADALSPRTFTRKYVVSVNPLDYMNMSNGNSWASCHTLDYSNTRGLPNHYEGMYMSGTISYMLDETSFLLYSVRENYKGNEFCLQPKVTRQMFHFGEEKLIQGRLYPQANDYSATNEYDSRRALAQEFVSTVFDFQNKWVISRGTSAASRYIETRGTHYPDYEHFDNCTRSTIKGSENHNRLVVGHDPVCVECGYEHYDNGAINCCHKHSRFICTDCGCEIDPDDVIEINGEYYCRDCVSYCWECEEWHRNRDMNYLENLDRYVCDYCLDQYYSKCPECGDWERTDNMIWVESERQGYCEYCAEELFTPCEDCGELVRNEDAVFIDGTAYCEDCAEEHMEEEETA